ncbi:unnamed protein product [Brassicogethes aeneus]|uniref:Androglobin-like protein n=1 Tax=Brassicogethes aeneus TaxID=1431903 RepID=A0A9P0B414_BRAAE|nr:unnamed protein product [Brassicogethes aeneus]
MYATKFRDTLAYERDAITDISPCWSHQFLIDQTRDIPIIKPEPWPELAFWKTFRWCDWAVQQGILPEKVDMNNIKCLKIYSAFRKHSFKDPPSQYSLEIMKNVETFEKAVEAMVEASDAKKGKKGKNKKKKQKKEKKSKVPVEITDPSLWIDYRQIAEEIIYIIIYFKPSRYEIKYTISDLNQPGNKPGSPVKGKGKGKGKAAPTWQSITYVGNAIEVGSESLYGFMDSIDSKFLVFNLSQLANVPILNKVVIEEVESVPDIDLNDDSCYKLIMQMKTFLPNRKVKCKTLAKFPDKVDSPLSYLAVQKYTWYDNKSEDILLKIRTIGTKTAILELPAGRHLFKLWIKSETPYICSILTDSSITIGNSEQIMMAMTSESQRLQQFCIDIASNYGKTVQEFGRPEFSEQLRIFHSIYKTHDLTKPECIKMHDYMFDKLIETVQKYMDKSQHKNVIRALHIFFKRIYFDPSYRICNSLQYLKEEDVELYKLMERSTIKIQALFKGIYVRSILNRHKPEHKEHIPIFELCKKVYTSVFSSKNRLNTLPYMLRTVFFDPIMHDIAIKYDFYNDLLSVINIQDFKGSIILQENSWAVVCRYIFFINNPDPIIVKIKFYFQIGKYMIRVFNNDTKEEVGRFNCNVSVNSYESNVNGYTILCYGYAKDANKYFWRLMLATCKTQKENDIIVTSGDIHTTRIVDNYIPNYNDRILRYFIIIKEPTLITLRLITSNEDVQMKLLLFTSTYELIQEIRGVGKIIMPAVLLQMNTKVDIVPQPSSQSSLKRDSKTSRGSKGSKSSVTGSAKKSSDKLSRQSSKISSSSRRVSKTQPISIESVEIETKYVVEAYILKQSWPLSRPEWVNVEECKQKKLYWPIFSQSSSQGSLPTKRKSSKTTNDKTVMGKPFWVMQFIHSVAENIRIDRDESFDIMVRNIKRTWWEPDPNRYTTSKTLRAEYIEDNILKSVKADSKQDLEDENSESLFSNSTYNFVRNSIAQQYQIEVKTTFASVVPVAGTVKVPSIPSIQGCSLANPLLLTNLMPQLDPQEYMDMPLDEIDFLDRIVLTSEDLQDEENERLLKMEEFEMSQEIFCEQLTELAEQTSDTYELLNDWYDDDVREDSNDMMTDVYEDRQKYIDDIVKRIRWAREREQEMLEREKSKSPKKKEKKGKKDKKKKK